MTDNLGQNEKDSRKLDYTIDYVTTSAISRISIKFLIFYIPILWVSGYMAVAVFFDVSWVIFKLSGTWIITMFLIPVWLFILYFIFIFGVALFTRAFLLMINMIHRPKEGVFRAEEGDQDYEFWRLRVELKKLVFWLMNNGPLPWVVMWGFRWMGIRVDFSSHMQDAWSDGGFIEFGRNVTVGQGAVVMSSMIIGKYLIIKKIIIGDHAVIGGVSNISPGTLIGKESVIGAFSTTIPNHFIEPGWIYLGPLFARKLKPNKYAEQRRDIIYQKDVDKETKYVIKQEVNIDEDKKNLLKNNKEE
jgi:carbonic anhydrase/acetyltransferase-like protein (isoleucine patch superfamily)